MKTFLLLLFPSFLLLSDANAQITFQKTYGGTANDWAENICATSDDSYIVTGITLSFGTYDGVLYLIKLDANGEILWSRTFDEVKSTFDVGQVTRPTTDGGYIVMGRSLCLGGYSDDILLMKLDSAANIQWSYCYGNGGSSAEIGLDVFQASDGGYVITGYSCCLGAGAYDAYIIRTDPNGIVLWSKMYGGEDYDYAFTLVETASGGFVFCGWTDGFNTGFQQKDAWLTKIDENGEIIWSKKYGFGIEWTVSLLQTDDGGFILTGSAQNSYTAGESDIFVLRTDSDGNVLWSKTYGGLDCDEALGIAKSGAGFILTGEKGCYPTNDYDIYLVKISEDGDLIWAKTFGDSQAERGASVIHTADGGFMLAGFRYGYGSIFSDIYLAKTDSAGNSGCNGSDVTFSVGDSLPMFASSINPIVSSGVSIADPDLSVGSGGVDSVLCLATGTSTPVFNPGSILVFPNPPSDYITIDISQNEYLQSGFELRNLRLSIINILGKSVFDSGVSTEVFTVNISSLPAGMYRLILYRDGKSCEASFIKE